MDIESIVKQVPHKRHRTGVKKSRPGTYVQFNYACNPDCPRCALESYATSQREMRKGLEKLRDDMQQRIDDPCLDRTNEEYVPIEWVKEWKSGIDDILEGKG